MLSRLSAVLLLVACAAGWMADRPIARPPIELGGYRVLAADFHTHSSMWSDGALTPWGLVLEAERQGLDAIAVTGHNEVIDAKVARWFSRLVGGATVLVGQEILAPRHHVIAVGVDRLVDSRLSVAAEVEDVHRQGGVAIAAHPLTEFWPAYDAAALAALDGAEICHPVIYNRAENQRTFEAFAAKGAFAAIGSSDFHALSRLGVCRTFVFATDNSAASIVDALRAHRTVVYGLEGRAYGDPALIALAATHPELRASATNDPPVTPWDWISRVAALAGLIGLVAASRGR
ncbi:MAG TPA: PHP-associated domain-containing protein [Vicinamibacterales bacterium]|nr:PHP-associated domain-containing protein [Vicinamibacterales bacterium]